MLITPEYKEQLVLKHTKKPWGGGGKSWVPLLEKEVNIGAASLVLDYGCGRHTFKEAMTELYPSVIVDEYDPGVPGFDELPKDSYRVYDVVVCTDVMEHVEEQFTTTTLMTIRDLTRCVAFFNIVTTPCSSTLPDGRNTHINLKSVDDWMLELEGVFHSGDGWDYQILERKGRLVCIIRSTI